jgi:hypothetical protein
MKFYDRENEQQVLGEVLQQSRQYLASNGVFDSDSFISMIEEDSI